MNTFKFLSKNEIVWRTSLGDYIPLEEIHIEHIRNIMRCLAGLGSMEIPENYLNRSRCDWLMIFGLELLARSLGSEN